MNFIIEFLLAFGFQSGVDSLFSPSRTDNPEPQPVAPTPESAQPPATITPWKLTSAQWEAYTPKEKEAYNQLIKFTNNLQREKLAFTHSRKQ